MTRWRGHHSLTASLTSTVAEAVVSLVRRLHQLPVWTEVTSRYLADCLRALPAPAAVTDNEVSPGTDNPPPYPLQRDEQVA